MIDLENDLQQLWVEVADKVGDKVAPKQPDGSPERGQFLLTQGLMFAELLPRFVRFIENYHDAHAHKAADGWCCLCNIDEAKLKGILESKQ